MGFKPMEVSFRSRMLLEVIIKYVPWSALLDCWSASGHPAYAMRGVEKSSCDGTRSHA